MLKPPCTCTGCPAVLRPELRPRVLRRAPRRPRHHAGDLMGRAAANLRPAPPQAGAGPCWRRHLVAAAAATPRAARQGGPGSFGVSQP
eukprot:4285508-Prymnesium_polylepis.1